MKGQESFFKIATVQILGGNLSTTHLVMSNAFVSLGIMALFFSSIQLLNHLYLNPQVFLSCFCPSNFLLCPSVEKTMELPAVANCNSVGRILFAFKGSFSPEKNT